MNSNKTPSPSLQTVERTLQVLNLFSEQQPELSLSEISRLLKTSKPVVLKCLNTLRSYGYLRRDEESKRYSLGFALIKLGNLAKQSLEIKTVAHPIMVTLSGETGESVYLIVPDLPFFQGICIDSAESTHTVTSKFRMSAPLYAGASKKAILAYLGEEYLASLLANLDLIPFTKNTVVDPELLTRQLQDIRDQGYAISYEETVYNAGAVAAPILSSSGIAGSLAIYIPLYRFTKERIPFLLEKILHAAGEIAQALG